MKVKGILFNTDMVRAILDSRKTVTRRVIKKPVIKQDRDNDLFYLYENENSDDCFSIASWKNTLPDIMQYSPYQPGDILYVRETWTAWSKTEGIMPKIHYKADSEDLPSVKWRPSIHMPKEAARIWLKVTDVRVERLHDITWEDGYREGLENPAKFNELWNSTIKKKDITLYGWDANPWVWVIEFERTVKPE